jgi:hypothetical protein
MKRTILAMLLAVSFAAQAAPFVEATVVSGVVSCNVVLDGGAKVNIPATALKCRYDVGAVAAGSHSVTMTAVSASDPVWGTQESAPSAPLNFTRPALVTAPSGLVLVP